MGNSKVVPWLKKTLIARLRGLLFIFGGIGLFALVAVLTRALDIPPGSMVKVLALPVALFIFVGWLELLTGVPFGQLSESFDKSRGVRKAGLTLLVIASIIAFIALGIMILNHVFS